ncbi:MAG: Fur family transcriptional regulator [Chloroflexota bacterium]
MQATVPFILEQLAAEGYPITDQRREVVALVMAQAKRFTADDLLAELRLGGLNVGRATVFRTLDLLVRLGFVGRVRDGGRGGYAVCDPGHHHHHLVCSNCGQVLHIDGCPVADYLEEIESTTGFHVAHHSLEIAGLCPKCSSLPASALSAD